MERRPTASLSLPGPYATLATEGTALMRTESETPKLFGVLNQVEPRPSQKIVAITRTLKRRD